jgi:hypothetical protein
MFIHGTYMLILYEVLYSFCVLFQVYCSLTELCFLFLSVVPFYCSFSLRVRSLVFYVRILYKMSYKRIFHVLGSEYLGYI